MRSTFAETRCANLALIEDVRVELARFHQAGETGAADCCSSRRPAARQSAARVNCSRRSRRRASSAAELPRPGYGRDRPHPRRRKMTRSCCAVGSLGPGAAMPTSTSSPSPCPRCASSARCWSMYTVSAKASRCCNLPTSFSCWTRLATSTTSARSTKPWRSGFAGCVAVMPSYRPPGSSGNANSPCCASSATSWKPRRSSRASCPSWSASASSSPTPRTCRPSLSARAPTCMTRKAPSRNGSALRASADVDRGGARLRRHRRRLKPSAARRMRRDAGDLAERWEANPARQEEVEDRLQLLPAGGEVRQEGG